MRPVVICWFKRDLRLEDHPALHRAAGNGIVIPLYIVEPELWQRADASARHYAFLRECLDDLGTRLAARGAPLRIRVGPAVAVLEDLRRRYGVTQLFSHEETGNAATYARDRAVAEWARTQGVTWQELPQCGVVRRLDGRDRWQARRDAFVAAPQCPAPGHVPGVAGVPSEPLPDPADLGLAPDPCPQRQAGGRGPAERALTGFLQVRGRTYRRAMSSPLAGASACSRISPYLALGALSVREVAQAAQARAEEVRGARDGWAGALRSFQARLAWRDHFIQKLESEPALEYRCLHPAYEGLRPATPDAARLAAWAAGQTGLPFVDACMRQLRATGWLNFRMRAMVMAVASYHLWLDWRATGEVLARRFTDYEPGIHWSQVQTQSGTTGMNAIRVYNPVKQGREQDPEGTFTRRWVPELAPVPGEFLQEPWRWPGAGGFLGRGYPAPVVDPVQAARTARAAVWAVRRQEGFSDTAQRLVAKHGSRRRRRPHPSPDRQLRLDL